MITKAAYLSLWAVLCCRQASGAGPRCLTGYMTDVQDWVAEDGALRMERASHVLDLSRSADVMEELCSFLQSAAGSTHNGGIRYLSLANSGLAAVPAIFHLRDLEHRALYETLEYVSFYNNNFHGADDPSTVYGVWLNANDFMEQEAQGNAQKKKEQRSWAYAFKKEQLRNLKELDLRSCSIRIIQKDAFNHIPRLEALYLGENNIVHIEPDAFSHLNNLIHLDISNNQVLDITAEGLSIGSNVFEPLKVLASLDMSNTILTHAKNAIFLSIRSRNLTRVSICNAALSSLSSDTFNNTNIKYLDISGNSLMLKADRQIFVKNLASSLIVLYADTVGLEDLGVFKNFNKLVILKVSNNGIAFIPPTAITSSWKKLQILDLTNNRLPSWFGPVYNNIPMLRYLSLVRNNLNIISDSMIKDLKNVQYVGMSNNHYVCSCSVRTFIDLSMNAEFKYGSLIQHLQKFLSISLQNNSHLPLTRAMEEGTSKFHKAMDYHTGFIDFNDAIDARIPTTNACCSGGDACHDGDTCGHVDTNYGFNTSFLLFDYDETSYTCSMVSEDKVIKFAEVENCQYNERSAQYELFVEEQITTIVLLTVVPLIVFIVIFIVLFRRWWCIKYFCVTMKNSAMLSLIGDEEKQSGSEAIYNYDVFVSYCKDDRAWVLDHLLPQVEADCNISVCLHERDFQVGLSILENIVSCIDRSRAIILVLSLKFLESQWCQFEMHLAQHRLLETRREDLILILLEDIPRRKRPNTLHYLMLTKTYIIWPQAKSEQQQFWRRVKRSLTQHNSVVKNKDSFA